MPGPVIDADSHVYETDATWAYLPERYQARRPVPITLEPGAAPYLGEFVGTRSTNSESRTFNSRFACYPAVDPALAQTQTFVCYAARIPPNSRGILSPSSIATSQRTGRTKRSLGLRQYMFFGQ